MQNLESLHCCLPTETCFRTPLPELAWKDQLAWKGGKADRPNNNGHGSFSSDVKLFKITIEAQLLVGHAYSFSRLATPAMYLLRRYFAQLPLLLLRGNHAA